MRATGVHGFASGLPFTPVVANAPSLNADFNYVRADDVGNPNLLWRRRNHQLAGAHARDAVRACTFSSDLETPL